MAQKSLQNLYTSIQKFLVRSKSLKKQTELVSTVTNKESKDSVMQPLMVPGYSVKEPLTVERSYINLPISLPVNFSSLFRRTILSEVYNENKGALLSPFITFDTANKKSINHSIEYSDKGMVIELDMTGYKQEDVNVRVEGPWLVVEGNMTTAVPEKEGGGLMVRNVIRRYEIPPNSDVSNIKMKFNDSRLHITVPALTPSVKKE